MGPSFSSILATESDHAPIHDTRYSNPITLRHWFPIWSGEALWGLAVFGQGAEAVEAESQPIRDGQARCCLRADEVGLTNSLDVIGQQFMG